MIDPREYMKMWQSTVDLLARTSKAPVGLVMRIVGENLEVFISSDTMGNPYHVGENEVYLDSGLYCETVIKTKSKLLVPNALKDEKWKNNPDIKLGMVSYLGFPLLYPSGEVFGTICILDNMENPYSGEIQDIMIQFKSLIEFGLAILWKNEELTNTTLKLEESLKTVSNQYRELSETKEDLAEMTDLLLAQNAHLVSLQQIGLELTAAADICHLCRIVAEGAVKEIGAPRACVLLMEEQLQKLRCLSDPLIPDDRFRKLRVISASGEFEGMVNMLLNLDEEPGIKQAIESKRIITQKDSSWNLDLGSNTLENWAIFPIKGRGELWGVLVAEMSDGAQNDTLAVLVNHAGVMMDNLRIFGFVATPPVIHKGKKGKKWQRDGSRK